MSNKKQFLDYQKSVSSLVYNGERRLKFNDNWRFQRVVEDNITNVQNLNYNDSSWRQLNLPHDWSIELDFNPNSLATHEAGYLDGGIGWYRKTFIIPSTMKGREISIDFDGVYMDSTTYINGELIGNYPFGYNAFSYDITEKVYTDGRENVLVIKVNNTQPSSRWYSGSGIYRNVYLTVTDPIHVERYGTFVTTPDLKQTYPLGKADVNIKTKIHNASNTPKEIKVKSTIYDETRMFVSTISSETRLVDEGNVTRFEDHSAIEYPKLWGIDNPYRYSLMTEVIVDEKVVDKYETLFGIRYFEFDADEGFSLNGQYMKLHGACMHHDLGALGSATNIRAVERQLKMMKDMGVNSIRVTHNPASPELLETANNLGLLVVDEAFDSWNQSKKKYDYSRFFSMWAEHDVKEMVDRGKNEPAIIMWSIGNEIYDTTDKSGVTTARNLVRWIKEIDTTRPTTIGEDKTRADKVNVTPLNTHIKEVFDAVDIVGLNYSENNYAGYHKKNPEWKIYGAETSSATRSRGVYTHPYSYNQSTEYPDLQQSSYDNDYVMWGRTAEDAWKYDRDLKHIAGQYIWTGFDYIGEPTPYYNAFPSNSSYFGAVDTAGFPKDIFYYYQSQWKKDPMLHILPHWNWNEGETVRVLAYTNAHKVELFLNGESLGERSYVVKKTTWGSTYKEVEEGNTYLEWSVPFEPGVLTAIGKDEQNEIIAEAKVVTAGKAARIQLTADRDVLHADGKDVSFVTVDVVDSEGHIVPTADNLVMFSLSGTGELIGVDNGNAASIERYKAKERQAFNGKALAIVQSSKQSGTILLKASALGLTECSVKIDTVQLANAKDEKIKLEEPKLGAIERLESAIVAVDEGKVPSLPATIKVYYTSGISRFIPVRWNHIDSISDNFTIKGNIDGSELEAIAKITIRRLVATEQVTLATLQNQHPTLPQELTVYYSDGTEKKETVTWDNIPTEVLGKVGIFNLEGCIASTVVTAKAQIRVTDEIGGKQNISRAKNGYNYPKVDASFKNSDVTSKDRLEAINDDLISYEEEPHNRWTNWEQVHRPSDWVSVTFGDFEPVEYDVDSIEFYWYANCNMSHPVSLQIEYKCEKGWAKVKDLQSDLPSMTLWKANLYTFNPVRTSEIRVIMTAQPEKAIAITELKIFSKWAKSNAEPKVTDIKLGEESILTCFKQSNGDYNYYCKIQSLENLPEITAIGEENTSITIVPALKTSAPAKIIAKSEDGKKTDVYNIHFVLDMFFDGTGSEDHEYD